MKQKNISWFFSRDIIKIKKIGDSHWESKEDESKRENEWMLAKKENWLAVLPKSSKIFKWVEWVYKYVSMHAYVYVCVKREKRNETLQWDRIIEEPRLALKSIISFGKNQESI